MHTLWLDPGLCIISSFFLQCVSQHDAELPTEGGGWAGYMCLGLGAVCGPTPCSLWLCAWLLNIFERRHCKLACESWVLIAAGALLLMLEASAARQSTPHDLAEMWTLSIMTAFMHQQDA